MPKLLLAEDDTAVASSVVDYLRAKEKHSVDWAEDGAKAEELLRFYDYELLILDWELPYKSGFDLLKEYRDRGGTASALFLTGKTEVSCKTQVLDAGADDYLSKPFDLRELAARVRALLRRGTNSKAGVLTVSDVIIDTSSHTVRKNGELIALTGLEYSVLEFLVRHSGTIFSSEQLLNRVWDSSSDAAPDMVRTVIKRIRHKLGESSDTSIIRNAARQGYIVDK